MNNSALIARNRAMVAVGMPVARHPRTDPYVRNSRMRLLSRMSGVETSIGVRMQNARGRQPAVKKRTDAIPTDIGPLAAMTKGTSPQPAEPMPKGVHRPKISRHSVVLIEALGNAPQPCPDLLQRLVPASSPRDGFIFANAEIETVIRRRDRLKAAAA